MIDRLRGPFAGGTWVLVNAELTDSPTPSLLRALLERAAQGPVEFEVRPTFACYEPGEQPAFVVRIKTPRIAGRGRVDLCVGDRVVANLHDLALGETPLFRQVALNLDNADLAIFLALDAHGHFSASEQF